MKLPFRQGIVRYQTDINDTPTFLQLTGSGVTLNVSPDPTVVTFSHGSTNYLYEENQTVPNAWAAPFDPVDQWLYWDLDIITGVRTFGITKISPVDGVNQPAPAIDRHWFDLQSKKMMVFTGARYVEKLRVFAAKLDDGGVLIPYNIGSQSGLNETVNAGLILYDDEQQPVKKFDRFGRGNFLTTESPLSAQFSRIVNYKLEYEIKEAVANEFIPIHYCVSYFDYSVIRLSKNTIAEFPCIGIASEDMHIGEARSFITSGHIKDDSWNWTDPVGTKLFVGQTGEITTTIPQVFSIQEIGTIVAPNTIYIDIKPLIKLQ